MEFNDSQLNHTRKVYGILDLLGDVGGLADALIGIGSFLAIIAKAVFGNKFDYYLVSTLFSKDNSHRAVGKSVRKKLDLMDRRQKFHKKKQCSPFSRNERLAFERGKNLIAKDLDVI